MAPYDELSAREMSVKDEAARTMEAEESDNKMGDGEMVPIIVSDILQPPQGRSPKAPERPVAQEPLMSARTTMSPPVGRQIAVHIKSSPARHHPHTPLADSSQAQPTTADRGRRLFPRPESASMTKKATPQQPKMGEKASTALSSIQGKTEGLGLQPKKRGRPKGWKAGQAYTHAKGDDKPSEHKKPANTTNGQHEEPRKRGRPPRAPTPTARESYLQSNPIYLPYVCEWEDLPGKSCPAELQNMETLRKHIYLIHGDADEVICRWAKCAASNPPLVFTDAKAFEDHMEKKHFRSHLWHRGEGYQNNGIWTVPKHDANTLPSYLFDKDGQQITPSITEQHLENDQHRKQRKRKLKELLYQSNENAPSEEEFVKQTLGMA